MAVLDQSYRRWTGATTGYLRRVLVIPRYDLMEILEKRTWIMAWLGCLVLPLVLGVWSYVAANLETFLRMVPQLPQEVSVPMPGAGVYEALLRAQSWVLVGFAVLVGPPLATRDFANGAIPLYLSKSLRRWDYVLGRCAVLALLLSLASWVPFLLVFALEWGMAKPEWRDQSWGLVPDIVAGTMPTVLLLSVLIVAVGATVQRANLARVALLFLLLGIKPLMVPLQAAVDTPRVRVVSPTDVTGRLREWAFQPDGAPELREVRTRSGIVRLRETELGVTLALAALAAWVGGSLVVIARRVRPIEVVK